MTWYASHIYAKPLPSLLSELKAHRVLSAGVYLVKDLQGHAWPTPQHRHTLPSEGLLVVREICIPKPVDYTYPDAEPLWHRAKNHPLIAWTDISGPVDIEVIYPPHLPVLAFGQLHLEDGKDAYPPVPFLRFLKQLSAKTSATLSFYHHGSGAERAVQQEFAWVFGEEECVYVQHGAQRLKYSVNEVYELSDGRSETVLTHALSHLGLNLPTPYFACHRREFEWNKHKV